jgi:gas vesicle protein
MAEEFRSGSGESALFAFVSGALLGAAAGLLFAPRAGRELREQLGGYVRQHKDQWGEIVQEQRGAVADAVRAGREAMQTARERLGGRQEA